MIVINLIGVMPNELQNDAFPQEQKDNLLRKLKEAFAKDSDVRVDSYVDESKIRLLEKHKVEPVGNPGSAKSLNDFKFLLVDL